MKTSEALRAWAERLTTVALPIDVVAAEAVQQARDAEEREAAEATALDALTAQLDALTAPATDEPATDDEPQTARKRRG